MDRLRASQTASSVGYGLLHLCGPANGTNNLSPDDAGLLHGYNSPVLNFAFEQIISPSEHVPEPVQTEYSFIQFGQPLFEPLIYICPRNGAGGVAEGNGGFELEGNPFFGNAGTAICEIITYDEDQKWDPSTLCWNNQPSPKVDAIAVSSLLVSPSDGSGPITGGFFYGVLDCRGTGKTIRGLRLRCEKPDDKTDDQVVSSGDFVCCLIYDGTPPLTVLNVISRSSSTTDRTVQLDGEHGLSPGAFIQVFDIPNNQYNSIDAFGHPIYKMVTGVPAADTLVYSFFPTSYDEGTTVSDGTVCFYPISG